MVHFVITNRKIINHNGVEVIDRFLAGTATDNVRCGDINLALPLDTAFSFYSDSDETPTYSAEPFDLSTLNDQWGSRRLFDRLCDALAQATATKTEVLFFIHGYGNVLSRTMGIVRDLDRAYIANIHSPVGTMITFTWPSQDFPGANYAAQQADAIRSGKALARIFMKLQKYQQLTTKQPKMHLLCQSMGNQVLDHMISNLANLTQGQSLPQLFHEIILTGADMDTNALEAGQSFSRVAQLGRRVHVYYGNDDRILKSAKKQNGGKERLGRGGPASMTHVPANVYAVNTTEIESDYLRHPIDFEHMHFIHSYEVVSDITEVLKGTAFTGRTREIVPLL